MDDSRRRPGNLPADTTSFVGRRRELTSARALLSRTRLLTLVGPGGIGKTRLALRLATEVQRSYPAGVWRVDVAAVERAELLEQATLAGLDLDHAAAGPPLAALADQLYGRRLLLLLDNCEHLLDPCALLVSRLLAALPDLHLLVTSRQALGVDGECPLPVPPLAAPHPDRTRTGPDTPNEALELFVDRAAAALGEFTPTQPQAHAAALICHLLEGIPLAVELAATRLRTLTCRQILDRLDRRFDLLTQGNRAAPARQQTLRAVLDWSFDLCTPQERILWTRLSAFAGSMDLEAAEAVCPDAQLPPAAVLDLVAGLIDKSVLIREEHGARVRYRMMETIRQYGRLHLSEPDERQALRRRHRDHYLTLVLRADHEWFTAQQTAWACRLDQERPNLRAALDFCLDTPGEAGAGLRMAAALWSPQLGADHLEENRLWLARALAADTAPGPARVAALRADGWLALLVGADEAAAARVTECRALAAELDEPRASAQAEQLAGLAALFADDLATGVQLLEDTLARHRADGDHGDAWSALFLLGLACCLAGDSRARALCQEGLELCERQQAQWARSWALWLIGLQELLLGATAAAARRLQESLRCGPPTHNRLGVAQCLEVLAWTRAQQDRGPEAAELLGAAQSLREQLGTRLPGVGRLLRHHTDCEARLRRALGDEAFTRSVQAGRALAVEQAVDRALERAPGCRSAATASPLTGREQQVVRLVAQGLTDKQIAALLVVSPRTAQGHVQRVLVKLGFTSRTQIATWTTRSQR
ncbi:putative ATPase/DNA-binding CsgD family transcriptional regulator [Kitasatospora sp. MAP12-15]|uniref:helix-turn-helix transcriptional regulator n=1 Tax=unclassified Kitasatospora TaxID=2633591 RepID=UPI002474E929|nr:LuxR C-terminal-related transcriptional regulator [Kitasatospora sp. MAP12-44]MDH6114668.1 putative ATPase/DNA-binding CsgD family transcriptional regulator [Kitasatospora sp. MAP12-44]